MARAVIRRYVLRRTSRKSRRLARAEDRKPWVSVCGSAIACAFKVAEDLIVSPVLFDYVDDVFDGRGALKQSGVSGRP